MLLSIIRQFIRKYVPVLESELRDAWENKLTIWRLKMTLIARAIAYETKQKIIKV